MLGTIDLGQAAAARPLCAEAATGRVEIRSPEIVGDLVADRPVDLLVNAELLPYSMAHTATRSAFGAQDRDRAGARLGGLLISFNSSKSVLSYLAAQTSEADSSSGSGSTRFTANSNTKARTAAAAQAALQAAASTHKASVAGNDLDKLQTGLAGDLRAAMNKAGVKLAGAVEFSVSSEGVVDLKGSSGDKSAVAAFLKTDASQPSFAFRIATQARDALKLSTNIQQSAAISQAARYAGRSGNVMALYTSLMQQPGIGNAVFTLNSGSSSLTYPGSLATKA